MSKIGTIGIVGAGQMGGGIAHVSALAGYKVLVYDLSSERIEKGLATINGNLARQVASGKLEEKARKAAVENISAAPAMSDLAAADSFARSLIRPPFSRPTHRRSRSRGWPRRQIGRSASSAYIS